jgi:hypothetical protein
MKPSKTELKRNITQAMIREHGEGLIRFFGLDPNLVDPIDLCKKLRRLENKAHEITTQLCNGFPELDHESQEDHIAELEIKLCRIEGKVQDLLDSYQLKKSAPSKWVKKLNAIFINRDPRGYALKVDDETVKYYEELGEYFPHQDWGGFGIIAPDLTSDIENKVEWISDNWDELNGDMLPTKHEYECRGFLMPPQITIHRGA